MYSKYTIRLLAFRIAVMKICGGAVIDWNYSTMRVCKSHNYLYWTWLMHTTGGFIYSFMMLIQQLSVILADEEEQGDDEQSVATTIIGFGEAAATTCICFLSTVITIHRDNVIYMFNELLEYDKTMIAILTADGRPLDKKHKMEMRTQEILMILVIIFTLVLPMFISVVFAHPIEPTRRMLLDWFEIEVSLTLRWLPVLMIFYILLIAAGNGAVILCLIVDLYFSMSTFALEDMRPKSLENDNHLLQRRYKFVTGSMGVLEDDQIIILYRHQQLFNVLINEIEANVMVSFHNIATILAVVSMAYFAIAYHHVLQEVGILGYIVVFTSLAAGLFIQLAECTMFGILWDASDRFSRTGGKLVCRRSLYKKFLRTCKTFYVEQAYPFYHIQKETFLLFCEQCLDYILELLLT